jgi:transcriptional regulator with XRE-family HTH domain
MTSDQASNKVLGMTLAQTLGGPWTEAEIDAYLRPLEQASETLRQTEGGGEDLSDEWFDNMRRRWALVGSYLRTGRERARLSKRAAARRAGISEGLWRHLEAGEKKVQGVTVFPNPRSENLVAVAQAVALDPRPIFRAIGRASGPIPDFEPADDSLEARIDRLNYRDRRLVEQLVESMLKQP